MFKKVPVSERHRSNRKAKKGCWADHTIWSSKSQEERRFPAGNKQTATSTEGLGVIIRETRAVSPGQSKPEPKDSPKSPTISLQLDVRKTEKKVQQGRRSDSFGKLWVKTSPEGKRRNGRIMKKKVIRH